MPFLLLGGVGLDLVGIEAMFPPTGGEPVKCRALGGSWCAPPPWSPSAGSQRWRRCPKPWQLAPGPRGPPRRPYLLLSQRFATFPAPPPTEGGPLGPIGTRGSPPRAASSARRRGSFPGTRPQSPQVGTMEPIARRTSWIHRGIPRGPTLVSLRTGACPGQGSVGWGPERHPQFVSLRPQERG